VKRGDVVILSQRYSDGSGAKVRPVLVVSSDRDNIRLTNLVVATISSNTKRAAEPTQFLIPLGSAEWNTSGLDVTSVVVCNNLHTADRALIKKTIGRLSPQGMANIDACLKVALDLN
jgi:mRNA interferase MazF